MTGCCNCLHNLLLCLKILDLFQIQQWLDKRSSKWTVTSQSDCSQKSWCCFYFGWTYQLFQHLLFGDTVYFVCVCIVCTVQLIIFKALLLLLFAVFRIETNVSAIFVKNSFVVQKLMHYHWCSLSYVYHLVVLPYFYFL